MTLHGLSVTVVLDASGGIVGDTSSTHRSFSSFRLHCQMTTMLKEIIENGCYRPSYLIFNVSLLEHTNIPSSATWLASQTRQQTN